MGSGSSTSRVSPPPPTPRSPDTRGSRWFNRSPTSRKGAGRSPSAWSNGQPRQRRHSFAQPGATTTVHGVCFVFTDMQDSTKLWQLYPTRMARVLELHDQCVRNLINAHKGYEVKTEGDAFMMTFPTATDAVGFSVALQMALLKVGWPKDVLDFASCKEKKARDTNALIWRGPRIRVGIHFGTALQKELFVIGNHGGRAVKFDYFGQVVNQAARISALAQGGQTLLSLAVKEQFIEEVGAARTRLPYRIVQRGQQQLKGIDAPMEICELQVASLSGRSFAPFRSMVSTRQQAIVMEAMMLQRQKTQASFSFKPGAASPTDGSSPSLARQGSSLGSGSISVRDGSPTPGPKTLRRPRRPSRERFPTVGGASEASLGTSNGAAADESPWSSPEKAAATPSHLSNGNGALILDSARLSERAKTMGATASLEEMLDGSGGGDGGGGSSANTPSKKLLSVQVPTEGEDPSPDTSIGMTMTSSTTASPDTNANNYVVRSGAAEEDEERIGDMTNMIFTITAISYAGSGDVHRLRALLDSDADWDASSCDYDFRTPLHLAACSGSMPTVMLLIERGANPCARDRYERMPADDARSHGFREVADYILAHGGDEARPEAKVQDGLFPSRLCQAASLGDLDTLEGLINLHPHFINEPDYAHRTALHVAVTAKQLGAVELLVSKGANVAVKDAAGRTPLDDAEMPEIIAALAK